MSTTRGRGRPPHPDVLTPAEWGVVEAVRHGLSNSQIARRREISLDAVKFHVANAVAKPTMKALCCPAPAPCPRMIAAPIGLACAG